MEDLLVDLIDEAQKKGEISGKLDSDDVAKAA